ncbi:MULTISPECIES: hypothetical protein [unclassified Pantoea]|jgi:hypothetical protein|uniref:hypothetical protein n=1 Tax=unclassified Pantoea TaxID=2630326 RepID=UPI00226B0533|nr:MULTISPECIES: hypothetical protein [unclassified Pantoea]MDF2043269.1 hypothetical protein [Pantoea sp. Cr_R14]MDF2072322.1 hypothetical protein [Pantoea sp. Cr_R13]MDF2080571.1 hypothetical protein [Pantoea sp. Cr_R21]
MDEVKVKALENSMMCLAIFSRSIHVFFAIYKHLDDLDSYTGDLHPYRTICNALLGDACINWCKVFGSDAEGTHWKNIVEDHAHLREVLFSELGITAKEFNLYWKEMLKFRSNVIAHFNSEHFANGYTPEFDTAIASASIAHKYFRESLPSYVNYVGPSDLTKYGADTAKAAMSRLLV